MSRRAEPGAVCRALGLLLLTAALLLFLGNCREARRAARTAQGLNEQLLRQIPAASQAAEGPRAYPRCSCSCRCWRSWMKPV